MLLSNIISNHPSVTRSGPNRIRISHLNNKSTPAVSASKTKPDLFQHPEIELYFISLYLIVRTTCLFGKIKHQHVELTPMGEAVQECWYDLPILYPNIHLDLCVLMPNHLHGIITLHKLPRKNVFLDETSLLEKPGMSTDIHDMMNKFIDISSKYICEFNVAIQEPIWKKPVECERIKNETRLNLLRDYIAANPSAWSKDPMNANRKTHDIGLTTSKKRHP